MTSSTRSARAGGGAPGREPSRHPREALQAPTPYLSSSGTGPPKAIGHPEAGPLPQRPRQPLRLVEAPPPAARGVLRHGHQLGRPREPPGGRASRDRRRQRVRQAGGAVELQPADQGPGRAVVGERRPRRDAAGLDGRAVEPAELGAAAAADRAAAADGVGAAPAEGRRHSQTSSASDTPSRLPPPGGAWAPRCDNRARVVRWRLTARERCVLAADHPRIEWLADPAVLAPIAVLVVVYVLRFRAVRRGGRAAGARRGPLQAAAFAGAILALLAHSPARSTASARTTCSRRTCSSTYCSATSRRCCCC